MKDEECLSCRRYKRQIQQAKDDIANLSVTDGRVVSYNGVPIFEFTREELERLLLHLSEKMPNAT